jgi:hypothetical protein
MKITSVSSWFDSMLQDIKYKPDSEAGKLFPFFVRVACIKRRPPRHKFFEMFLDMGMMKIESVLNHIPLETDKLNFVFPERFMGVAEQQSFMTFLKKHPESKNIKQVDIITSSPLILSSFMRDHIRIITWPEDEGLYNGALSKKMFNERI